MKFLFQSTPQFILGFWFNPSYSAGIQFGWIEVSVLFKKPKESALESLPEFPHIVWPCQKCGAEDHGQPCNMETRLHVTNCGDCSEVKIG